MSDITVTNLSENTYLFPVGGYFIELDPGAIAIITEAQWAGSEAVRSAVNALLAIGIITTTGTPSGWESDGSPPQYHLPVSGSGGGAASPLVLTANDGSEVPLKLVAATGQTDDLLDVYDENGNKVVAVFQVGLAVGDADRPANEKANIILYAAGDGQAVQLAVSDKDNNTAVELNAQTNGNPLVNIHSVPDVAGLFAIADDSGPLFYTGADGSTRIGARAAAVPLHIHADVDQTADLLDVYDENGDLVFSVHPDGSVHIKAGTSIQADL